MPQEFSAVGPAVGLATDPDLREQVPPDDHTTVVRVGDDAPPPAPTDPSAVAEFVVPEKLPVSWPGDRPA